MGKETQTYRKREKKKMENFNRESQGRLNGERRFQARMGAKGKRLNVKEKPRDEGARRRRG